MSVRSMIDILFQTTEILDKLGKANNFSTPDLASGFHQIEADLATSVGIY